MRGADTFTESLLLMRRVDDFVPSTHPLQSIRAMVNKARVAMSGLFSDMYEADIKGGPSVEPEKLLRAMSLQVLHSVCSKRPVFKRRKNRGNAPRRRQMSRLKR